MGFPNVHNKHEFAGVLTASQLLEHKGVNIRSVLRDATAAILCYQKRTLDSLAGPFGRTSLAGFSGRVVLLTQKGRTVVAAQPGGIGGPSLAIMLEELAACGVKKVIAVGMTGSMDGSATAGSTILPSRAIRDEGTSHHYMPGIFPAHPTHETLEALGTALRSRSVPFIVGPVWSTDAPFRETSREIREFRAQGALVVDMESATLFVVSSALGLECACGLVVSDTLTSDAWHPAADPKAVDRSLTVLAESALEAVSS